MIIFNSKIRSILDYAFIPTLSPCQKISSKLQTLQTRDIKSIKYFPLKTSTQHIHNFCKTERVKSRASEKIYSIKSTPRTTRKRLQFLQIKTKPIPNLQTLNNFKLYFKNLANTRTV